MTGQMIGKDLSGDFYWFDCPDCKFRMILLRPRGAYDWIVRCGECGKMYTLQMHLIYDPKEKQSVLSKHECPVQNPNK